MKYANLFVSLIFSAAAFAQVPEIAFDSTPNFLGSSGI